MNQDQLLKGRIEEEFTHQFPSLHPSPMGCVRSWATSPLNSYLEAGMLHTSECDSISFKEGVHINWSKQYNLSVVPTKRVIWAHKGKYIWEHGGKMDRVIERGIKKKKKNQSYWYCGLVLLEPPNAERLYLCGVGEPLHLWYCFGSPRKLAQGGNFPLSGCYKCKGK